MKKITRAACLILALLLAGLPLFSGPAPGNGTETTLTSALMAQSSDSGQALQTMALGPGLINLSPADEFSTYQWGLKNDGEFRLIELKSKFKSIDNIYDGRKSKDGTTKPGPGDYESTVIGAVTGIDINVQPAWKLYDQAENKRSVIVAIIDTGIDINHLELKNAIWTNPGEIDGDGIDNDGDGYVDDIHGWNFYSGNNQVFTGSEDSMVPMRQEPSAPPGEPTA